MESIILFVVVIGIVVYISTRSKNEPAEDENCISMDDQINGAKLERIITNYGKSLTAKNDGLVYPISLLENSKREIKYAIPEYIRLSLKHDKLTKEQYDTLQSIYCSLNLFVDDELAEKINADFREQIPPNEMKTKYGDLSRFTFNPLPEDFPKYD